MKAILVAGGAGYIGSHTCKNISAAGYLPVTIDNLSTGNRDAVKWGPLVEADIHDNAAISHIVGDYDIIAAIHFAAYSSVGESAINPAKYYDNNVSRAVAFISSLLNYNVHTILFSSTAAVYGQPQCHLIAESHSTVPINAYGATKLAFERALYWLGMAHGLNYTILRYFNAAGADFDGDIGESHEPETHLIPSLCKAVLGIGAPLTVYGADYPTPDGTAVRDYIHVVDLAAAHVRALERMLDGGASDIFNVGTGVGASVADVIRAAEAVFGRPVPYNLGARRVGDPEVLVADPSKLMRSTGWTPCYSDLPTILRTAMYWQKIRPY